MADIIFQEDGCLGVITLNRPRALNALSHAMIRAMQEQLEKWADAKHIQAVLVEAVDGRAFCAGGDVREIYEGGNFFQDEYKLNHFIYHYSKPYIALLNGITMGGGVGISLYATYRIATEKLIFAMPETGIGFFPDVGTSYFLSRLPHKIGFYIGLTGANLSCHDCFALGIVTHLTIPPQPSELLLHKDKIRKYFSYSSIEEIIQGLESDLDMWCQSTAKMLKTKSPISLKVTLKHLQESENKNFDTCIKTDAKLLSHFIQSHDFFEGVRAAVIDKDQSPKWVPGSLQEVSEQMVERFWL